MILHSHDEGKSMGKFHVVWYGLKWKLLRRFFFEKFKDDYLYEYRLAMGPVDVRKKRQSYRGLSGG